MYDVIICMHVFCNKGVSSSYVIMYVSSYVMAYFLSARLLKKYCLWGSNTIEGSFIC